MVLGDADLTTEDLQLRNTVREFAARELARVAVDQDRAGRVRLESLEGLAALGLYGLAVQGTYGGSSATRVQISLVIEEIARVCASTALTLMAHIHSSGLIAQHGDERQKQAWLPDVASGRKLCAVGLTEPDAGTDVGAIRAVARLQGDRYIIDARKTFITNGDHADVFVVFAKLANWTGPGPGVTAFIVDAGTAGLVAGAPFKKLGLRGSSTTELSLDSVVVPVWHRLGQDGEGYTLALRSLDGARLSTAAQAVGIAEGAFDVAFGYGLERFQSGKVIAEHQAVQLRLADMRISTDAGRALLYEVARAVDNGEPGTAAAAAATKVYCTQNASTVASRAVELLGGYGFMEEYSIARYMRDAKGGEIYDGTNDINRLLIARQLIKEARRRRGSNMDRTKTW
jgi:alkylation response protein AidB-like acyl-CoA dehydrogenase